MGKATSDFLCKDEWIGHSCNNGASVMSPQAASSLVHDLVEMAKATERLPEIEAENERLKQQHVEDGDHIAQLELRLMDRANRIDELTSHIRSLEVERDDYGFRALAADDKANALALVLKNVGSSITAALLAAEPEPEPVPTEPVIDRSVETGVGASPETHTGGIVGERTVDPTPSSSETQNSGLSSGSVTEGEREPLPTAPLTEDQSAPTASSVEAYVMESIPQTSGATATGPYTGKLYMREPGYISRLDWLDGGGTAEAYDWRPGTPVPEGFTDYNRRTG